jgi:hypothetical protein
MFANDKGKLIIYVLYLGLWITIKGLKAYLRATGYRS